MKGSKKGAEGATTALATKSDSPVFQALETVKQALAGLSSITDKTYKTNTVLGGFQKKVQDETDISSLVKMMSSVKGRHEAYNKAHEEELSDILPSAPVFKAEGHTFGDWKEDIRLRIQYLSHKERYDELMTAKKELESLMDREDRIALVTARIGKIVGGQTPSAEDATAEVV